MLALTFCSSSPTCFHRPERLLPAPVSRDPAMLAVRLNPQGLRLGWFVRCSLCGRIGRLLLPGQIRWLDGTEAAAVLGAAALFLEAEHRLMRRVRELGEQRAN